MSDLPNHNLPGTITSISVQKNNKERYSIFVDDEFLIGISEQTLLKFNLAKGDSLKTPLYRKIQRQEGRFEVKSYMMKMLGRRVHSRKELFTKSIRKDYAKDVIEDVLDELQQKGYLNESDFADKFASDKCRLNKWGPQKIKSHLFKKGIANDIAEKSIQKAYADINLEQRFLDLVLKRKRRFLKEENLYKRKKKVVDHLARKGYRSGNIFDHINGLMEAIAE